MTSQDLNPGDTRGGPRTDSTRVDAVPETLRALIGTLRALDVRDLPALIEIQESLSELAAEAERRQLDDAAQAGRRAADLVGRLVMREVSDVQAAIASIVEDASVLAGLLPPADSANAPTAPVQRPRPHSVGPPSAEEGEPVSLAVAHGFEDALGEFLLEARDHLATIETTVLALERDPSDADGVNALFRAFHTIKGVAGFLGLEPLVQLTHAAEYLLDRARGRLIRIDRSLLERILGARDLLARMVAALAGESSDVPLRGELRASLRALEDGSAVNHDSPASDPPAPPPVDDQDAPATSRPARPREQSPPERTVKVSHARLDALIDLVGELAIARAALDQDVVASAAGGARIQRTATRVGTIVRELQDVALGVRMVSLRSTFQRVVRLVRDLAVHGGKRIETSLAGEDVELDRMLVERLGDPLIHLVRNACDHGIETPEERVACGKPAHGTLSLRARHRAGRVEIEVSDDGRGLQRDRILATCVKRGLLRADATVDALSDVDVHAFIFQPGFSTAEKVTDISGRGVGMDVVKRDVEAMRGSVLLRSIPGVGTTFTISLPLTLAILDGMVVRAGDRRYVIPVASIQRTARVSAAERRPYLGDSEALTTRDGVIPLDRLDVTLGHASAESPDLAVIVECAGARRAVLVHAIESQQEVVVKPLEDERLRCRAVSGAAILGDGTIALVLEPATLALAPRDAAEAVA